MRQVFDDMYHARVIARDHLPRGEDGSGSETRGTNVVASYIWATLQAHMVMADYAYHDIRRHPSITAIFVRFLVEKQVSEPQKDVAQMKRDYIPLKQKYDRLLDRVKKLEEKAG